MNKIVNWTFGSFFRTLGRFAFYIIIGILLSYLLNGIKLPKINLLQLLDVYADVIVPNEIYINNSSSQFDSYQYLGNSTNNSNVDLRINLTTTIDYVDYNFIIADICASSEPYVDRAASVGNSCSTSCFSNAVSITKTNTSCKSNNVSGNIYRVQSRVVKYGLGTQYITLDDKYYVSIPKTGNNYIALYGVYLVNEDTTSSSFDYTSNFSQIDSTISSSSQNIINNQNSNTQDVINNQNSNTQDVIDNQNSNTQDVIDNQNSNTQDIIDSQSANTQAQIDSQKVCTRYDKNAIKQDGYLIGNGNIQSASEYGITDYININGATIQVKTAYNLQNQIYSCFYNINKTLISCVLNSTMTLDSYLNIPANAEYLRFTIIKSSNRPQLEICKNGNQAMQDTLTDSSAPTNLDSLNNSAGWLPAGPVDGILNLPLSFLTNLNSNLSKSCEPVNLPLPFINRNLPLPCVNSLYSQINGLSTWINTIGIIASAFILFGYFINLYKYIDDTLTFRENNYIDNWSGV